MQPEDGDLNLLTTCPPPSTNRDRFRTMINVLGDALAAGIIAHLCRKDFPLSHQAAKVIPHAPS